MVKVPRGMKDEGGVGPTPKQARGLIRAGALAGQTSNLAPGFVQANLAILPADWADEFLLFCHRNPKPCPVIAVTQPGEPIFTTLGDDVDVRTDVARYKVFRDGALVDEPSDLLDIWRDDLVAFAIGCSFSFEEALVEAGLRLRHYDEDAMSPCIAPASRRRQHDASPARWSCRCVRSRRARRSERSKSPRAFPTFMAHLSIWVIPEPLASPTFRDRTSAMRYRIHTTPFVVLMHL